MKKLFSWRHAIQQSWLNSTTKLVLLNLSIYMNERGGGCFPSIKTQSSDTGLCERSVYAAINQAERAGYLKKHKTYTANVAHNNYVASVPDGVEIEGAPLHQMHPAPDAPLHQMQVPPAPDAGTPLHQMHPNSPIELSNELSNKKTKAKKDSNRKLTIDKWEEKNGRLQPLDFAAYGEANGFTQEQIARFLERFRDNCKAHGRQYVNFAKAFTSWNWRRDEPTGNKFGARPTVRDAVADCFEAIERGEL